MNSTVYLFGNFGQGITLYPNDYTKDIFKEFTSRANAPTQLIIHRDRSIMNYGYIRKIENGHLFGICIQINGQYLIEMFKHRYHSEMKQNQHDYASLMHLEFITIISAWVKQRRCYFLDIFKFFTEIICYTINFCNFSLGKHINNENRCRTKNWKSSY